MRSVPFVLLAGALPANAFKLLLTSYGPAWQQAGAVQVLEDGYGGKLTATSSNQGCGAWPTWSDISLGKGLISCVDEMEPGSLNMLQLQPNGDIKNLSSVSTIGGPVSTVFYNDKSVIALAHYSTPAISTFRVTSDNKFVALQNFSITTPPGPNTDRQDRAHIHQAILDPTGSFLLFPNLGSDVVHVYSINKETNMITEQTPLKARPGYGPRHATFWRPSSYSPDTYMFLVNELANRLVSYKVSYAKNGTLGFTEVDNVSTFGNRNGSADANAAEIAISPDNRFIITSNRLSPINITNPDPSNSTAFVSDTIATFKPSANGDLQFVQLAPSGGLAPRHFSLNCDGTMIAVANFVSRDVAVYERNVESGMLGKEVARGSNMGAGSLTHVAWLENDFAGFW